MKPLTDQRMALLARAQPAETDAPNVQLRNVSVLLMEWLEKFNPKEI